MLVTMCQAIAHRGPDDHGVYFADGPSFSVGLGAQRLSILDLTQAGHMPMKNDDETTVIVYNGEIYNHLDLRADLERHGYRYRSRTDTETVLYAYEAYGVDSLPLLNGMFAMAIYDRRNDQVLIARDRLGIKPLYYSWDGRTLLFASELKSLLAVQQTQRRVDRRALDAYLSLGYVPAPYSLIEGIHKLPAGHYLLLKNGQLHLREFWGAGYEIASAEPRSDKELIELTRQTLEQAIQRQLMSDVPVGILLSGGLDSTIVAAVAQKYHDDAINTFSIGFESQNANSPIAFDYNADRHYAALAAERIGTQHHEIVIRDDGALADLLGELIQSLDEPVWEASFLSIYRICRLAREHGVKVVLTGDGSDELFAGYSWYRGAQRLLLYEKVPFLDAALPVLERVFQGSHLGSKAEDLRRKIRASSRERYRVSYDHFSRSEKRALLGDGARDDDRPDSVDDLVGPLLARAGGGLVEQLAYADLRLWVGDHFNQRLDRMSAACSVEARVPFQDNSVVDLALSMPVHRKMKGGEHKYLLRRAFADLLPVEILNRPKRPFAAPQHSWFRSSLNPLARELLSEERVSAVGALDSKAVRHVFDEYVAGRERRVEKISILVMFQLWCEQVLHQSGSMVYD